jgi:hypothetical protein
MRTLRSHSLHFGRALRPPACLRPLRGCNLGRYIRALGWGSFIPNNRRTRHRHRLGPIPSSAALDRTANTIFGWSDTRRVSRAGRWPLTKPSRIIADIRRIAAFDANRLATAPFPKRLEKSAERLFVGRSEPADLMKRFDWASTPIGPPELWPQSLKTAVRIMPKVSFPTCRA